jgi:hypothetical protein
MLNNVPARVQEELYAAAQRTGPTEELKRAAARLPLLFAMSPATFEQFSADIYDKTS